MRTKISIFILTALFSFRLFAQSADVNTLPPIDELGTGKYKGETGGLYPDGRNIMPADFFTDAVFAAKNVVPRNKEGMPDANGKIGLITIGASTVAMFSSAMSTLINATPDLNPAIVFINGGVGAQDLNKIYDQQAKYWIEVESRVAAADLSNAQIQVAWLQEDDLRNQSAAFPGRPRMLVDEFTDLIQKLKIRYPNLQIIYLTARHTTDYMPAESKDKHKEPRAYLNGWAMKWLIEEQINGNKQLQYTGADAKAPLLMWGPYFWTQGSKTRADGYSFTPDLVNTDGVHPNEAGKIKVANDILSFWQTDPVSQIWFQGKTKAIAADTYLSLYAGGKELDKILSSKIQDDIQVLITDDSTVVFNKVYKGMLSGKINVENIAAGDYKYLWLSGTTVLGSGNFTLAAASSGSSSNDTIENADSENIKPYDKNNVPEDQPAWFVNGTNKLAKIKRTVGGDPDRILKAVFIDPQGKTILTIEDALHKHTILNDVLPQGAYVLKFYEASGEEVVYQMEIPEYIHIK